MARRPKPSVAELRAHVEALDQLARGAWPTVALSKDVFAATLRERLGIAKPHSDAFDLVAARELHLGAVEQQFEWVAEIFAQIACQDRIEGAVDAVAKRYLAAFEQRVRKRRKADGEVCIGLVRRVLLDGPEALIVQYRWDGKGLGRFLVARARKLESKLIASSPRSD